MKIEIQSVWADNFMSFKRLRMPEACFEPGLYLVEGVNEDDAADGEKSNEAGKSVLAVEALSWGLFGKTVRELARADDVVRWHARADDAPCCVVVHFKIGVMGYSVERTRWLKSELTFGCQDGNLTKRSIAETQAEIEKTIGMDWRTFCSSFVFGQSSTFKFSSLPERERRLVLEAALGVEVFRQAAARGRVRAKNLYRDIESIEAHVADRKVYLRQAQGRVRKYEIAKQEIAKQEVARQGEIAALKARLDFLPAEEHIVRENLYFSIREAKQILETAREKQNLLARRLDVKETRRNRLISLINVGQCPTCGQIVPGAERGVLEEARENLAKVRAAVRIRSARLDTHLAHVEALRNDVHSKEERLQGIEQRLRSREKLEVQLRELLKPRKPTSVDYLKQQYEDERRKIEEFSKDIEERETQLQTLRGDRDHYNYLVSALGDEGVATAVVEHAVPILNRAADEVAAEVAGDKRLSFVASRETEDGKIVKKVGLVVEKDGVEVPYDNLSAGGRASVDFVAGVAVQTLVAANSAFNVAVFDEVLDHLDRVGGTRVVRHLEELAKTKAVWLISHAEWIRDAAHWKRVLRVVHKDGVSKLVKEEE